MRPAYSAKKKKSLTKHYKEEKPKTNIIHEYFYEVGQQ